MGAKVDETVSAEINSCLISVILWDFDGVPVNCIKRASGLKRYDFLTKTLQ